jgi:hypothetical protein
MRRALKVADRPRRSKRDLGGTIWGLVRPCSAPTDRAEGRSLAFPSQMNREITTDRDTFQPYHSTKRLHVRRQRTNCCINKPQITHLERELCRA